MLTKYQIRKKHPKAKFGASRAFIPLDEKTGMKIPYTERGKDETEKEAQILFNDWYAANSYGDILPKGIEELKNGYIVERLHPVNAKVFKDLVGLNMQAALQNLVRGVNGEKVDNKLWENEWWVSMVSFCKEYNYAPLDVRKANLGHDGENVKLLDFVYNAKQHRDERVAKAKVQKT